MKIGRAEDLRRVQRRRGGEPDLHRVEVVEHPPVLRDVVVEAPETELGVGQLAIEQVAAVALVHDDAVVLIDRRGRGVLGGIEHPLHHALHGGDVHRGVGVRRCVLQLLDAEDVGEGLQVLHPRVLERVGRLLAERGAIDQEQHAPEPLRLQQAIDERDAGLRLAGAGRHREQHLALALRDGRLDGLDRGLLVVAQREAVVEGLVLQLLVGALSSRLSRAARPSGVYHPSSA